MVVRSNSFDGSKPSLGNHCLPGPSLIKPHRQKAEYRRQNVSVAVLDRRNGPRRNTEGSVNISCTAWSPVCVLSELGPQAPASFILGDKPCPRASVELSRRIFGETRLISYVMLFSSVQYLVLFGETRLISYEMLLSSVLYLARIC